MIFVTAPAFAAAQTQDSVPASIQGLSIKIAQIEDQISHLQAASSSCVNSAGQIVPGGEDSSRPLSWRYVGLGSSGSDVEDLQTILHGEGLLATEATGYFGTQTEAALRQLQAKLGSGIISSGDRSSPGWGAFGPTTIWVIVGHLTCPAGEVQQGSACVLNLGPIYNM